MENISTMYQSVIGLLGAPMFLLFAPSTLTVQPDTGFISTSWNGSVEDFIAWERPIASENILCNIGPECAGDDTVGSGIVLASPSKIDPDYFDTWTRDAALVFRGLVEIFSRNQTTDLQTEIHNYIMAQAQLQAVENPSGNLRDGSGLAEPRFHVDLTAFTKKWGRPQRDGPPLRAIAMIAYANWLLEQGDASLALDKIWPVVQNDLSYVVQYWNNTGFDLWEEVEGSSFFTTASQYRALVEGSTLAKALGFSCPHCDLVAPQVLCFLQQYWSPEGYILCNINSHDGRSGKDVNAILASIHSFDPSAGCNDNTFQPCSSKILATHKALIDSFRDEYPINHGVGPGKAVAIGRYPEDVYYGGHPWYLATLAAAEQMYDALYAWQQDGYIEITDIDAAFFHDFSPELSPGKYLNDSSEFGSLMNSIASYADGFIEIVADYVHPNGSIAEQFTRDHGTPISARDLTWSYGAFLSAVSRREKKVPRSWLSSQAATVPDRCIPTSIIGYYATATPSPFPLPDKTPKATQTGDDPSERSCPTTRYVVVKFEVRVKTSWGEKIKMVGNENILGAWDPNLGVELDAAGYTEEDPVWAVSIVLLAGQDIEYKFISVGDDGKQVAWESDPNRTYSAPGECETTAAVSGSWQ